MSPDAMQILDLNAAEGRLFPARRLTKNVVGGVSPIQHDGFALGLVELAPEGGQVPWHNHVQEEVYLVLDGEGEVCVGAERRRIAAWQAVHIPSGAFHQMTNTGDVPLRMLYAYAPAGEVAHWRQELDGTLPRAGDGGIPPLPDGAWPQHTDIQPATVSPRPPGSRPPSA